jgi:hypothetical protein
MKTQPPIHKTKISAILNLIAGVLFIMAAFHVLTGESGIDWMWIVVGTLFIIAGIWGFLPR